MKFFGPQKVAVLVVNDDELCIAEFERAGSKPSLLTSCVSRLAPGIVSGGSIKDRHAFVQSVKNALRDTKPSAIESREIVVVLPESQVYLTVLRFTSERPPHEVLQDAPREALSVIPLDQRQIYCDFFAIPKQRNTLYTEVLYAACDSLVANEYLEAVREAGLKPIAFCIEPEALLVGLSDIPAAPFLVFVRREKRSPYMLIEDGFVKKAGSASEMMDFTSQVETYVSSYMSGRDSDVAIIKSGYVYTAAPSMEERAGRDAAELKKRLGIEVKKLPLSLPEATLSHNIAFGAARRVLFRNEFGKGIDLLPARFREQAALLMLESFVTSISIMCIIAASALLSVFSYAATEMYFDINRVQRNVAGIAQNVKNPRFQEIKEITTRFNQEVEVLTNIQRRLFSFDDLVRRLHAAFFVDGITPISMQFTASDMAFKVTGIAETREDLSRLKKGLEAIAAIGDVISPLSNLDKTTQISFVLTITLDPKKLPYIKT